MKIGKNQNFTTIFISLHISITKKLTKCKKGMIGRGSVLIKREAVGRRRVSDLSKACCKKISSYLQKILGISRIVWYNKLKTYEFTAKDGVIAQIFIPSSPDRCNWVVKFV